MIDKVSLVIFYARSPLTPLRIPSAPDVLIPAGAILIQCPAAFQFNPAIWGPDAHIFNPDRHDQDHPSATLHPNSRDPYAMATFSNGPQICLGRGLSLLETKSLLTEIARRWEVRRGWDANGVKLGPGEEFESKGGDGVTIEEELPEKNLFAGVRVHNFCFVEAQRWVVD